MNYSVIIGIYQGMRNLKAILDAVNGQTVKPKTIFVWSNMWKGVKSEFDSIITVESSHNLGCFARFTLAGMCQTDAVMVLDDDTVPGCKWAQNCIDTMERHKRSVILGCRGIILRTNSYYPFREAGLYAKNQHTQECDLVGHSWFFMREHTRYIFDKIPIRWDTGEDMHFSAYAKMAGIRTFCPAHPTGNQDVWGSIMPSLGKASGRLHTSSGGKSFNWRGTVVKHLITQGWKPLFMEKQ